MRYIATPSKITITPTHVYYGKLEFLVDPQEGITNHNSKLAFYIL